MKQSNTESFRIEKDILDSVKKIISKTGQTSKSYIEIVLKKQIEKDLKKHFKEEEKFYCHAPAVFDFNISGTSFNKVGIGSIVNTNIDVYEGKGCINYESE